MEAEGRFGWEVGVEITLVLIKGIQDVYASGVPVYVVLPPKAQKYI